MRPVETTFDGVISQAVRRIRLTVLPSLPPLLLPFLLGTSMAVSPATAASRVDPQSQSKPAAREEKPTAPAQQLKALREQAEKGSAQAQYRLAVALRTGK